MTDTAGDISSYCKNHEWLYRRKSGFYMIVTSKESNMCTIMFNKNYVCLRKGRF